MSRLNWMRPRARALQFFVASKCACHQRRRHWRCLTVSVQSAKFVRRSANDDSAALYQAATENLLSRVCRLHRKTSFRQCRQHEFLPMPRCAWCAHASSSISPRRRFECMHASLGCVSATFGCHKMRSLHQQSPIQLFNLNKPILSFVRSVARFFFHAIDTR